MWLISVQREIGPRVRTLYGSPSQTHTEWITPIYRSAEDSKWQSSCKLADHLNTIEQNGQIKVLWLMQTQSTRNRFIAITNTLWYYVIGDKRPTRAILGKLQGASPVRAYKTDKKLCSVVVELTDGRYLHLKQAGEGHNWYLKATDITACLDIDTSKLIGFFDKKYAVLRDSDGHIVVQHINKRYKRLKLDQYGPDDIVVANGACSVVMPDTFVTFSFIGRTLKGLIMQLPEERQGETPSVIDGSNMAYGNTAYKWVPFGGIAFSMEVPCDVVEIREFTQNYMGYFIVLCADGFIYEVNCNGSRKLNNTPCLLPTVKYRKQPI